MMFEIEGKNFVNVVKFRIHAHGYILAHEISVQCSRIHESLAHMQNSHGRLDVWGRCEMPFCNFSSHPRFSHPPCLLLCLSSSFSSIHPKRGIFSSWRGRDGRTCHPLTSSILHDSSVRVSERERGERGGKKGSRSKSPSCRAVLYAGILVFLHILLIKVCFIMFHIA